MGIEDGIEFSFQHLIASKIDIECDTCSLSFLHSPGTWKDKCGISISHWQKGKRGRFQSVKKGMQWCLPKRNPLFLLMINYIITKYLPEGIMPQRNLCFSSYDQSHGKNLPKLSWHRPVFLLFIQDQTCNIKSGVWVISSSYWIIEGELRKSELVL